MQDESREKSTNWVAGLSTSFPIFCEPVLGNNASRLLAASRYEPALRRLQNRLNEGKTLCRTSECPQIFGVKRLRNCEYNDRYLLVVWKFVTQKKFSWLRSLRLKVLVWLNCPLQI